LTEPIRQIKTAFPMNFPRGGVYRDSLLETAQEAVPIAIMSAIDVTGKT